MLLTRRVVGDIIHRAMAKEENLLDYVLEVGVEATDAEDAMSKWRKEGVVITVTVGRPRMRPGAPVVPASLPTTPAVVPASGSPAPKDVFAGPKNAGKAKRRTR